jgi:T-complex protein 1 subunit alpha
VFCLALNNQIFSFASLLKVLCIAAFLAGGGAVEAGLSIYLENFATSLGSREQLAIAEFADALLVIPKTLAVNAAKVGAVGLFSFLFSGFF